MIVGMEKHPAEIDRLQLALRESEDRFSKIFNASPSMIVISAVEDGRHYAVNGTWLQTLGYERHEVIGKTAHEIGMWVRPEDRSQYIDAFKENGKLRDYEVQLKMRNGDIRIFSASCDATVFDSEPCLLTVFHDITNRKKSEEALRQVNEELERKVAERMRELQRQVEETNQARAELEESERRLIEANRMMSVVLDSLPVHVFWKDRDLNFLGCNRLFAQSAGYETADQLIGKSDYDCGWRKQAKMYRGDDMTIIISETSKLGYEEPQTTPDGDDIWLRTSKTPLRNAKGEVFGVLGIFEDITARRVAENALEEAKNEAEQANRAKSDFLTSMSHELRTPLNAILGFAQLLEHDPRTPLTDGQQDSVNHIKSGGKHLLGLINEILELAKIEAGHLELDMESVRPHDVFHDSASMTQALAEKYDITLHVPALEQQCPNIFVDRMRFKQVLLNLLSNAVKYNVQGGEVTLDCQATDGRLKILITDTGAGISPDGLKDLFQPFARLDHEDSEIEGTGIGLTITKQLVECMGGEIGVESELGQGTTFWVTFPISTDIADLTSDRSDFDGHKLVDAGHRGKVLYVEDDRANLVYMENLFGRFANLELLTAQNAEEGLEIAAAHQPDMIMLDISLPGMSGTDMLKTMKSNGCCKVSAIAISADAMPYHIEEGLEAGFDAYLTKPFDVGLLVQELERVFGAIEVTD